MTTLDPAIYAPQLDTADDLWAWYRALAAADLICHPDDSAWLEDEQKVGIINAYTGEPTFTPEQAQAYDRANDRARTLAARLGIDIYTILDTLDHGDDPCDGCGHPPIDHGNGKCAGTLRTLGGEYWMGTNADPDAPCLCDFYQHD